MIHTYTLYTHEIDRPDAAIDDISHQLAKIPLCKHSAGIVACHYDYVEYGIFAALGDMLPFPLIGCTTFFQATPAASGLFALTITLLTSDDVRFAAACIEDRDGIDAADGVHSTYRAALGGGDQDPSLILSFLSASRPFSGDAYLRLLDAESGGVPTFGFVDSGEDESGTNTYILCNDQAFTRGLAVLLMFGESVAHMYVSDPLRDKLLSFSATVTAAEGVRIERINDQPAAIYIRKNGIDLHEMNGAILTSLPFYYREPGSNQYICRLLQSIGEDGSLTFLGEIPQGVVLRIGAVTAEDIVEEAQRTIGTAVSQSGEASLFLIASCVGRFITLGLDTTSEMDHLTRQIPPGKAYMACYAGGEICPISKDGMSINRYHNNSLIILSLR